MEIDINGDVYVQRCVVSKHISIKPKHKVLGILGSMIYTNSFESFVFVGNKLKKSDTRTNDKFTHITNIISEFRLIDKFNKDKSQPKSKLSKRERDYVQNKFNEIYILRDEKIID